MLAKLKQKSSLLSSAGGEEVRAHGSGDGGGAFVGAVSAERY
jgi:hypothetical protein